MPLRGKNVNLGDKLNEMTERNIYMNRVFELTQKKNKKGLSRCFREKIGWLMIIRYHMEKPQNI